MWLFITDNWLHILLAFSWLVLAFAWPLKGGGFWKVDQRLSLTPQKLKAPPSVAIIVPARNEAEVIAQTAQGLLSQNYQGEFTITIVNDSSTDDTAKIVEGLDGKNLTLVNTTPLPDGWAGKMWALYNGIETVEHQSPDYYWLTDADILHKANVLTNLVTHAENNQMALVSEMVKLRCNTFWEKLLTPAFIFYFSLIYPFRAVNDPNSEIAGAAGGSILVRRQALEDIGGIKALKGAVIDDCTLAKLIKGSGRNVWLGFGERSTSLRGNDTLADHWQMVQRSAYTQLGFSPVLLVAAMIGLAFSHILPVLLFSWPALLIMAVIYWPTIRFYGLSPIWALTLPISAILFGLMTISSALSYHLGWSNKWRDRQIAKS